MLYWGYRTASRKDDREAPLVPAAHGVAVVHRDVRSAIRPRGQAIRKFARGVGGLDPASELPPSYLTGPLCRTSK
jgi:hypothetical protein